MRVALVTHYYEPELGAPQRRWSAFVQRWVAAGHEVEVLAPLPHYPTGRGTGAHSLGHERGRHGETVIRLPFLRHGRSRATRLLDQSLTAAFAGVRRGRWDVVIATAPGLPSLVAGRALARRAGAMFVVEMRDVWPDLLQQSGSGGRLGAKLAPVITWTQRSADLVVTVTDSFADVLRSRGMRRVEVVPNGVDVGATPWLPPAENGQDRLEVLYLGNLGESQRLETAITAAAIAGPGVRLTLVGDGVDRPVLKKLADGTSGRVRVLDPVSGDARWPLYRGADTCLVQLRAWEAFRATVPSKLYEVMAVGRHVSAGLAGTAAHIVQESGAGDVVPPESAEGLAALWQQLAAARGRLDTGRRGREWVERHADYDELSERYVRMLALSAAGETAPVR